MGWREGRSLRKLLNNYFRLETVDSASSTKYRHLFAAHNISGDILLEMTYESLKEIGVQSVGDRARILQQIKKLRGPSPLPPDPKLVGLVSKINSMITNSSKVSWCERSKIKKKKVL